MNRFCGAGTACDYTQSPSPVCDYELSQNILKEKLGRICNQKNKNKKLCHWYVGKTGSLETFWEAEISRLPESLKYRANCSPLPVTLPLMAETGLW